MTEEYGPLKTEQLERIKQRDGFLNLNVVAIGVVTAIALQEDGPALAWLILPWVTTIMGWAYLSNDDKVTAIAKHLAVAGTSAGAASWEHSPKGLLPAPVRRIAETVVFSLSFVLPAPVALAAYGTTYSAQRTWPVGVVALVTVEILAAATLAAVYGMSMIRRR